MGIQLPRPAVRVGSSGASAPRLGRRRRSGRLLGSVLLGLAVAVLAALAIIAVYRSGKRPLNVNEAWSEREMEAGHMRDGAPASSVTTDASLAANSSHPLSFAGARLNREALGRAAWTVLHATAAHYPAIPTALQQRRARELVWGLVTLYPCEECRRHFAQVMQQYPLHVQTRDAFLVWTCRVHNEVNARLHKPRVDCTDVAALDRRWRDCGCDQQTPANRNTTRDNHAMGAHAAAILTE